MKKKTVIHNGDGTTEGMDQVEPATLIKVKVVEIKKKVEVPVFTDVKVEVPVFVDKEFEVPVLVDKKYERPVIVDKEYERPVIVEKEDQVKVPVAVEVKYDKFVPVEVKYDRPIVEMERLNSMATALTATMQEASKTLAELKRSASLLKETVAAVNEVIPKSITVPKIIEEEVIVKKVNIIEDTIHVIGKVIAKDR